MDTFYCGHRSEAVTLHARHHNEPVACHSRHLHSTWIGICHLIVSITKAAWRLLENICNYTTRDDLLQIGTELSRAEKEHAARRRHAGTLELN